MAEAVTGKPPPSITIARRKRREETSSGFGFAAIQIMRRAIRLPADAYAAATGHLWDTLDWLNQWHSAPLTHYDPASEVGEDVHAHPSNPLSLHL